MAITLNMTVRAFQVGSGRARHSHCRSYAFALILTSQRWAYLAAESLVIRTRNDKAASR